MNTRTIKRFAHSLVLLIGLMLIGQDAANAGDKQINLNAQGNFVVVNGTLEVPARQVFRVLLTIKSIVGENRSNPISSMHVSLLKIEATPETHEIFPIEPAETTPLSLTVRLMQTGRERGRQVTSVYDLHEAIESGVFKIPLYVDPNGFKVDTVTVEYLGKLIGSKTLGGL